MSKMVESNPDPSSNSISDKYVKAPNIIERAKEEIEAIVYTERQSQNCHKETHGLHNDIDVIDDVKAPNVFDRAKEEIEALVQTIHSKKEPKSHGSSTNGEMRDAASKAESKHEKPDSHSDKDVNAPNLVERLKEEREAIVHKEKSPHRHHKETHGMSDDIDVNTPIGEIKGPNVFERAKEEIEALVQTILPNKEPESVLSPPNKEGGFWASIGWQLEKVCSPWGHKRD